MKSGWIITLVLCLAPTFVWAQEGQEVYKAYCAGCHGANLEGNSATPLIKTEWKYGRGKGAIVKNITFGIPDTEMVAWQSALTKDEINAVADFIIAAQETPVDAVRALPAELETEDYEIKIEKLVEEGISTPWGIEFTDATHALITERNGGMRWLVDGKLDPTPIEGLPATYEHRTGGYMDLALDPDYANNGWIYFGYSKSVNDSQADDAKGMTKVVRGKIKDHQWTDEQTLFEAPDSLLVTGGNRWGCRLLFDKEGYLYFTIGDMGRDKPSQDLGTATGKTFRINADGSVPKDNPFVNKKGALPQIFTYGNRNVQGMAQNPETGDIWATEHGPMGGDELNILKKGANYGWPVITYGVDYSGEIVSDKTHEEGMEQPITQWTPSIAVCPIEFSTSSLFPKWKNNLLVGALAYEELRRLVIENNEVKEQEVILKDYGRVRDIKTGPDGAIYVLLNSPDMVVRLTPEKEL